MRPAGLRTVFQSTAIYTIGLVLQRALSLVMLPLYTSYIPSRDYAVIDMLDTAVALFGIIFGARFSGALLYHSSEAEGDVARRDVLTTAFFGGTLIGLAGGLVGFFGAPWIARVYMGSAEYAHPLRIMFGAFALGIPVEIGWSWLRLENRTVLFVCATLAQILALVGLNVLFIVRLEWGYISLMWTSLICYLILFAGFAGALRTKRRGRFDRSLYWRMIKFTAPLGATVLATFIFHSGDRYFLIRNVPLSLMGEYALAYKVCMVATLVGAAFHQYWGAQVYTHARGENGPAECSRIFTYIFTLGSYVAFGVWAFAAPLLTRLTDEQYHGGIAYVPWLLLAYNIRAIADFLRSFLYVKNSPGLDAWSQSLAAAICLIAYAALIPRFGVWGAVAATIIGYASVSAISAYYALRLFPFRFEVGRLLRLAGVLVTVGASILLQPHLSWWGQTALAAAASAAFPVLLFASGYFDRQEVSALRAQWESLRQKALGAPASEA